MTRLDDYMTIQDHTTTRLHTTARLHDYSTTLLHFTTLLHYYNTTLLNYYTTALSQYRTTALLYYCTPTLLYEARFVYFAAAVEPPPLLRPAFLRGAYECYSPITMVLCNVIPWTPRAPSQIRPISMSLRRTGRLRRWASCTLPPPSSGAYTRSAGT